MGHDQNRKIEKSIQETAGERTATTRPVLQKYHTSERTRVPIQDSLDFSLYVFGLELRQNALEVLEALAVQVVT